MKKLLLTILLILSSNVFAAFDPTQSYATVNNSCGQIFKLQGSTFYDVNNVGSGSLPTCTGNVTITGNITGNAATVTTNANLTGPITSTGNATAVASQTGTGSTFVMQTSPTINTPTFTAPVLGTPASGVATNLTGTASGLTAGTVTTNANLTGVITSIGNTTSIASQTGTGTKFVVDTSPTIISPFISSTAGFGTAAVGSQALRIFSSLSGATNQYGINLQPTLGSDATSTGTGLYVSPATAAAVYTLPSAYGVYIDNWTQGASSTITAQYGLFVNDQTRGATNYAIKTGLGIVSIGGAIQAPNLTTTSAAQTGTVCWTTGTGNFTVDTTTTCLLSARKYKENILPLNIGLAEVMKLRPVSYQLKQKYNPTHLGRQVGFIADEVQKIDARFVSTEKNGDAHAVRYQQMIALLTKAIQEQQAEIDKLKKQVRGNIQEGTKIQHPELIKQ